MGSNVQRAAVNVADVYLAQVGREKRARVVRFATRGRGLELPAIASAAKRVGLLGSRDVEAVLGDSGAGLAGLEGFVFAGFRRVGRWFVLPGQWRAMLRGALGGKGLPASRLGFQNEAKAFADGSAWDRLVAAGLAVRCPVCRAGEGLAVFHVLPAGGAALDVPADVMARAWPVRCPDGCGDRNG